MSQLDSLVAFITENVPPRVMKSAGFDNWMDNPKLIPSNKGLGLDQRRIGLLTYEGVISWDRFPYLKCDPQNVFALVLIWLGENSRQDNFTLDETAVDLELVDDETAILTITLGLADEVCLVLDEKGPIPMEGQRWRIGSPTIWTAESANVYGATVDGTETE